MRIYLNSIFQNPLFKTEDELSVGAHRFNPSILEAETVQGQPWSHIQFQASMSYILISCFKSKKSKWTKALKNKCLKPGVMCNNLGPVIPAPQEAEREYPENVRTT